MYYNGSTIRFQVSWYDWNENLTDPTVIKFKVYDEKMVQLLDVTPSKMALGVYFYDLVPTLLNKQLIYEWYAEIDGSPSIKRGTFRTVNT